MTKEPIFQIHNPKSEGPADLADFLPPRDHPLYLEVLRELVRVDLELSWKHGHPSALEAYRRRFPELFQDRTSVNAIHQSTLLKVDLLVAGGTPLDA